MFKEEKVNTKTFLVFIDVHSLREKQLIDDAEREFFDLTQSSGAEIVGTTSHKQSRPSISHFINKGKLEELYELVHGSDIGLVIINHKLSASQARNLELKLKVRVIDKTELILDIFATRATTHIGKLQVELAQLNHLSTRLTLPEACLYVLWLLKQIYLI